MSHGLQIVGSHGAVQVDADYRNLAFRQKGTASLTNFGDGFGYLVSVPVSVAPLICWRQQTSAFGVGLIRRSVTGGTAEFEFRVNGGGGTLAWWLFDVPQNATSGYGMAVYTASGSVAFSTAERYMRVASVTQVPNATAGQTPPSHTASAGSGDYAACLTFPRQALYSDGVQTYQGFDGVEWAGTGSGSFTVLHPVLKRFSTAPSAALDVRQPVGGQLIIVDVGGL